MSAPLIVEKVCPACAGERACLTCRSTGKVRFCTHCVLWAGPRSALERDACGIVHWRTCPEFCTAAFTLVDGERVPLAFDPPDDPPDAAHEAVDHPAHYGGADDPYEALKVMIAWHGVDAARYFCQLNAEKYLCRADKKGAALSDLRKAAWYAKAAGDLLEYGAVR